MLWHTFVVLEMLLQVKPPNHGMENLKHIFMFIAENIMNTRTVIRLIKTNSR